MSECLYILNRGLSEYISTLYFVIPKISHHYPTFTPNLQHSQPFPLIPNHSNQIPNILHKFSPFPPIPHHSQPFPLISHQSPSFPPIPHHSRPLPPSPHHSPHYPTIQFSVFFYQVLFSKYKYVTSDTTYRSVVSRIQQKSVRPVGR